MQSTGRKVIINDSMYQNKTEEQYPVVEVSAKSVPELKVKNHNQMFSAEVEFRVCGIHDKDLPNGDKETFYSLELRQLGMKEKSPEEMTSGEILQKVEEEQV